VVFDEAQKAKNPASRTTAALKSVTAEFFVAMTGTPVENSLADLWSIADVIAPGMLPPLVTFVREYTIAEPASLERLSGNLLTPIAIKGSDSVPPFSIRRMKADIAAELPKKHDENMLCIAQMSGIQADKYAEVDAQAQAGNLPMLRALHDFRSISLHPIDPAALSGELGDTAYIAHSARMKLAFDLLKKIKNKREKALIFLDSKKIQNVLALLIERELECPPSQIIRGDVNAYRRQEIVDEFSRQGGFATLILSPRAAGVGLNITAANHVIHLDRWCNPAVEDQCTDRAYRIGQTKAVWVYALAAQHPVHLDRSYDLILHNILERKRRLSKHVFAPGDLQVGDFSDLLGPKVKREDSEKALLVRIDGLTPLAFEEWTRDLAIANGLSARSTPSTRDGGADIVVRDAQGRISHLIQCKHTSRTDVELDAGMANDINRMRLIWAAPDAIIIGITNAQAYSKNVRAAAKNRARLIARNEITSLQSYLSFAGIDRLRKECGLVSET